MAIANSARSQQDLPMNFRTKIVPRQQLPAWRVAIRRSGRKLVVTNGSFDIPQLGPLICPVLDALESVSAFCIFGEKRATHFLAAARTDIHVKGGDYTLETLDQDGRGAVESCGSRIGLIPLVPGRSATRVVEQTARQ
jgi:bifunctional ADP-heptose synthase (sugar kinase/adenylyltransferase)